MIVYVGYRDNGEEYDDWFAQSDDIAYYSKEDCEKAILDKGYVKVDGTNRYVPDTPSAWGFGIPHYIIKTLEIK